MHFIEMVLGIGYISIAAIEYKLIKRHHGIVVIMERTKQFFMTIIGASYVAHAGVAELIAALLSS